mgnify:CR=1 FL=1
MVGASEMGAGVSRGSSLLSQAANATIALLKSCATVGVKTQYLTNIYAYSEPVMAAIGDADAWWVHGGNTRVLAEAYRSAGYRDGRDLLHVVQAGAEHSESYWAQRLPAALRFLLKDL